MPEVTEAENAPMPDGENVTWMLSWKGAALPMEGYPMESKLTELVAGWAGSRKERMRVSSDCPARLNTGGSRPMDGSSMLLFIESSAVGVEANNSGTESCVRTIRRRI